MTHGPGTAGELLAAVVAALVEEIRTGRAAALADEPDAVHQLRTSVRRLRNLLAAFRRCFDPVAAAELATALASYGDLLGECRDLEVRAADATAALTALGLTDAIGAEVLDPLRAGHRSAHAALVVWHDGPGVGELDRLLAAWSTGPALAERAGRPAERVAIAAVRRQVGRVLARADAATDGAEEPRHDLRKAARRLRHTADAVAVVAPGVVEPGRLGHRIQGALGDYRDALLLAEHAHRCGTGASYERLVEHAEQAALAALDGLDEPLAALRERHS